MSVLCCAAWLILAAQQPVREQYDSGAPKAEYQLDKDGKRHGSYVEWWERGPKKLTAAYHHGALHGEWRRYHENGKLALQKHYRNGVPLGEVRAFNAAGTLLFRLAVQPNGVLLYPDFQTPVPAFPRSLAEIRKKLLEIDPPDKRYDATAGKFGEPFSATPPYRAGSLKPEYLQDALRLLNAYRYLSGLSPTVALDAAYNDHCQHAAVLLAATGNLSHDPARPADMSESFFKKGHTGAASSNLSSPGKDLRSAVHSYMDDSDPSNIREVGHRSWILNPAMGKCGFGEADGWRALWAIDDSVGGAKVPETIAYPAAGHFPEEFLAPRAAWSLAPKGKLRLPPEKEAVVQGYLLSEEYDLVEELRLDHVSFRKGGGMGEAVVFRWKFPEALELHRHQVLVCVSGGKGKPIVYLVRFFRLGA